eukprot:TRINITY_DN34898_c0_g1_i1.p1 TRINITY_DN34898_c0_g1~~TRINITY_DN34898_c0_g1_i1.p1  ORF type:complete len:351 (+),score=92.74 TRINITY_DN34898_c0_g1_i1:76-1053(+)
MSRQQLTYRTVKLAEGSLRSSRHILHLDATGGTSATAAITAGTKALVEELQKLKPDLKVERLDLWDQQTRQRMEYTPLHEQSKAALLAGSAGPEDYERFVDVENLSAQLATSRGLIVSTPAWTLGAPWVLKQYFDCVVQPGLTCQDADAATASGLLGNGRPLVVVTNSQEPREQLTSWLRGVAEKVGFDNAMIVPVSDENASTAGPHFAKMLAASLDKSLQGTAMDEGEKPELVEVGWPFEQLAQWLRLQGGVSEDALESLMAMKVNGGLWFQATEDDWRNEELGLEEADIARLLELQKQQKEMLEDLAERDPKAAAAIVGDDCP